MKEEERRAEKNIFPKIIKYLFRMILSGFFFQGTLCAGGVKPGNEEVEIFGRVYVMGKRTFYPGSPQIG